ncbi:MAG: hypothetical protein HOP19_16125 [Acidobacteria bacterium]|nr:hypothetical protein [Acidobacteriota bacterium]
MTTTEILSEIQKLPLTEQRTVLLELKGKLDQAGQADLKAKERKFINAMRQKGLITEIPLRLPDDEVRRHFKPIEIKGEPLSETIIKERG